MYKSNPNILIEDTSDAEVIMHNRDNKNTIVLNYTAKILYESFVNNEYAEGIKQYLNKAGEIFNISISELEEDAKTTLEKLVRNNVLIEEV